VWRVACSTVASFTRRLDVPSSCATLRSSTLSGPDTRITTGRCSTMNTSDLMLRASLMGTWLALKLASMLLLWQWSIKSTDVRVAWGDEAGAVEARLPLRPSVLEHKEMWLRLRLARRQHQGHTLGGFAAFSLEPYAPASTFPGGRERACTWLTRMQHNTTDAINTVPL
jgi:hypothetical protein